MLKLPFLLVLLHEFALWVITIKRIYSQNYLGDAYFKFFEELQFWDPRADFCMSCRQENVRMPYACKDQDGISGKLFERKSPQDKLNSIRNDVINASWNEEKEYYGVEESCRQLDD